MHKNINNKPLTIKDVREVLIPAMEKVFATKKDLENFVTKEEFGEFKNLILTSQNKVLKKLDILLLEKKVDNWQHKRRQKFYRIIVRAMYRHKVLSESQLEKIKQLGIF